MCVCVKLPPRTYEAMRARASRERTSVQQVFDMLSAARQLIARR